MSSAPRTAPALLALTLLGCSDASESRYPPPLPARVDITGTWIDAYVQPEKPDALRPRDLSGKLIEALVIDDAGAFGSYPGIGLQDGTFRVPYVPAGPYYLRIDDDYAWLTGRKLELGWRLPSRPDVDEHAGGPLTLEVSGLAPSGDLAPDLWLSSFTFLFFQTGGAAAPAGATSFSWPVSLSYLLSAADRLDLLQRENDTSAPIERYRAVRFGSVAGIDATPGAPVSLPVALADPTPEMQKLLSLKGLAFSEIESACALAGAPCEASWHSLAVVGLPSPSLPIRFGPELLRAYANAGHTDLVDPSLAYANPFPAALVRLESYLDFTLPDPESPGAPLTTGGGLFHEDLVDAVAGTALGVALSLPRAPMADGQPLTGVVTLASTTPVLSWTPPEVGAARVYAVSIQDLGQCDPSSGPGRMIWLHTDGTSLRVPPGRLVSGRRYRIGITAEASTGDHQVSPGRDGGLPRSIATIAGFVAVP